MLHRLIFCSFYLTKSLLFTLFILLVLILFLALLLPFSLLLKLLWLNYFLIKLMLQLSSIWVSGHKTFFGSEYFALNVGSAAFSWIVFLEQHVISLENLLSLNFFEALIDIQDLQGCAFAQRGSSQVCFGHH